MSFFRKIIGNYVVNQFNADLTRVTKLPMPSQFFVFSDLLKDIEQTQEIIQKSPFALAVKYFNEQANKAKDRRHQALRVGSTSENDPLWLSAALMESLYNTLRTSKQENLNVIFSQMTKWMNSVRDAWTQDAVNLVDEIPTCTAHVIIISNDYDDKYNCKVIVSVHDLLKLVNTVQENASILSSYKTAVSSVALSNWLLNANLNDCRAIQLCPEFYSLMNQHFHSLATNKDALIYCNDCRKFVENAKFETQSKSASLHNLAWREEWTCPNGHTLLNEDQSVSIQRSSAKIDDQIDFEIGAIVSRSTITPKFKDNKCERIEVRIGSELESNLLTKNISDNAIKKLILDTVERKILNMEMASPFFKSNDNGDVYGCSNAPRVVISSNNTILMHWERKIQ